MERKRSAAWFATRTLCKRTFRAAICAALFVATAPTANATLTKITTGDIVTIPAWYWNGAWGDYDDDGYLDLFVGASFPSNRNFLYHNNSDGTFALIEDAKMPKIPSNQHGAAWGDYDNDGHLDLIVTAGNPETTHNVLYQNNGDGTFSAIMTGPIYEEPSSFGFHGPSWGDYDNDGFLDLFIAGHEVYNRLFRNNGDRTFTRITSSVVVSDFGASEGRAWVDYDNDGDVDLFVSNNRPYTSFLYRNEGNGVFTKVTDSGLSSRVEDSVASCWADYDNDGFLDLFLANDQQNSLYHNNGDGTFTRVTDSAVVGDAIPVEAIFSSCAWGDYDNDGFIDLFVTVGDFYGGPPRTHNFLYHNNGDGTFTKVTEGSVVNDATTQCPGASWGDYDNDGFLDLFVSQGAFASDRQTNFLYHNDGNTNGWLNVKLVGSVSNRSAIGAKVRVNAFYSGQSRWQLREISGGDSESNQQSLNAEFGLADATNVDTVRVEWPSGIVQELHNVAPRQFLTVTEPPCTSLPDSDGDGICDAKDICTNVGHGRDFLATAKPRMVLAKINTDAAAGNDKLTLRAQFTLPPTVSFSALDPKALGARLVLRNRAGEVKVDTHVPPEGYRGKGTRGWRRNSAGTTWTYRDRTTAPVDGVITLMAVDHGKGAPGGAVKVRVVGENGRYPVIAGDEPVQAAVVLGNQVAAAAGKCGESDFSASDCRFNSSGTRLTCRK